ncbi:hypothetical protein MtrunA17_Chr2g0330961 [Medicago truncatula]|uniref:Uncharacterized protein n=1 Tax=Medicago truncatula TaxID=3880 RepID=A0A396JMS9_MEDTR|nr:hypothetical protein MtrunA17_Chr2g0330961 [Medicago truncatula]
MNELVANPLLVQEQFCFLVLETAVTLLLSPFCNSTLLGQQVCDDEDSLLPLTC